MHAYVARGRYKETQKQTKRKKENGRESEGEREERRSEAETRRERERDTKTKEEKGERERKGAAVRRGCGAGETRPWEGGVCPGPGTLRHILWPSLLLPGRRLCHDHRPNNLRNLFAQLSEACCVFVSLCNTLLSDSCRRKQARILPPSTCHGLLFSFLVLLVLLLFTRGLLFPQFPHIIVHDCDRDWLTPLRCWEASQT